MREYAREQLTVRLGRLAFETQRTASSPDEEAVHDLRVSIRRFSQGLKVFSNLVAPKEAKRMRKRLHRIMRLAGEVRNRDLALRLAERAGVETTAPIMVRFASERREYAAQLRVTLRSFGRSSYAGKWLGHLP